MVSSLFFTKNSLKNRQKPRRHSVRKRRLKVTTFFRKNVLKISVVGYGFEAFFSVKFYWKNSFWPRRTIVRKRRKIFDDFWPQNFRVFWGWGGVSRESIFSKFFVFFSKNQKFWKMSKNGQKMTKNTHLCTPLNQRAFADFCHNFAHSLSRNFPGDFSRKILKNLKKIEKHKIFDFWNTLFQEANTAIF